jgi:RimJ/RimL family protein N-acetyltransferase
VDIPVLETERLILRAHTLADFDAYTAYWADENVTRWTGGGKPLARAEAWLKFLQHPGHWEMCGFGFWAVEEKASGQMIGEAGFIDLKRDYDPLVNEVPEIGWVIAPSAQGKGYATEAALECMRWGAMHFGHIRVIAAVNVANVASIRVAEKCGFKECLRKDFHGRSAVFFDRVL